MERYCRFCGELIPEGRLKALPNTSTCVQHSQSERYGAITVVNHKTGNETQIVKDADLAREINTISQRKGYGVSRGIKGTVKRKM